MQMTRAYMKGSEFQKRQQWLPFMDAVGIVLQVLEPVKAAAWQWFKEWCKRSEEKKTPPDKGGVLLDLFNGLPWADQPRLC